MKKLLLFVCLTILIATAIYAQVTVTKGPVDLTMKMAWDMPAGITLADTSTYEMRLKDTVNNYNLSLTNVSCIVPAGTATVSCTSPFTSGLVTQLNIFGTHSLTLSVFRADVGDSGLSIPFSLATPLTAPTNFRVIK